MRSLPFVVHSPWLNGSSFPDSALQNAFEILLMDGDKKIITLYCKTAEEKEEWITAMSGSPYLPYLL